MLKHYKKLILILIPACAGFCLALALGSAGEPSELCHLCQNKALVKEAILALDEDPYDANLPEQFDPNYVQYGASSIFPCFEHPNVTEQLAFIVAPFEVVRFESIIAEGDMVSVRLTHYSLEETTFISFFYRVMQLAIFRISRGKIVEGWVATGY